MRRLALLFAAVALLTLAGCGARQEPLGPTADHFPVVVTDAAGRSVTIAAAPQIIATSSKDAALTLRALGYAGRVAPVTATPATVKASGADLMVVDADVSAQDADRLAAASGVPVLVYGDPAITDAPAAIADLGLAAGQAARGAELARGVSAGLAKARAEAKRLGPVRTVIDAGALVAQGPETTAGRAVQLAGGVNIVQSTRYVSTLELRRFNPQAWAVLPDAGTTLKLLRSEPGLGTVAAVRGARLIPLDPAAFGARPGLDRALARLVAELHAGTLR